VRKWNFSGFLDLEPPVVQPYGEKSQTRPRENILSSPSRFTVAISVAALAASFTLSAIQSNTPTVRLPVSAVSYAQSIPQARPPLSEFFAGRYDAEWTESVEDDLLTKIESNRLQGRVATLEEQTIDAVLSNQLEDLSDASSQRLSRDQIAALVKTRKLQR
jgi:hypothetical protein